MDKKAFSLVRKFIKAKPWLILGTVVLLLALSFGEQQLSAVLTTAGLTYADVGLAVIRMILQSALMTVLVLSWHRRSDTAAPFAAIDILKLFLSTFLLTLAYTACVVTVVLIPLAVWLFLRTDFYMNYYITGKSNGVFSCIGTSFRRTKGHAKRYLIYNVKYLLFYFLIQFALAGVAMAKVAVQFPDTVSTALDIFDLVFTSVFMPYRFLLKCGFYETYLHKEANNG